MKIHNLVSNKLKKKQHDLDESYTWARNMVTWYCMAGTLFWQLSIDHKMDLPNQIAKM